FNDSSIEREKKRGTSAGARRGVAGRLESGVVSKGDAAGESPGDRRRAAPPVEFYIRATSSILERRPRTLKHGDTLAVFDHYGNLVAADRRPEGLYHRDTRYLSGLDVLVNGRRPLLL